jgi:DNA-binding transcriptional LysR family regulator
MRPNLTQIRSFVAIAKAGSFTGAARAVHLSQPALTVQIRQLEALLGVRLIDRNTRSVSLTRIGREVAPIFERVLHELDSVVAGARELASKRHGVVRLACLPSFAASALPRVIAAFRVQHPAVQFVLRDGVGSKIVALVKADAVDFAIAGGEVADPDLTSTPLMSDRLHAVYRSPHVLDREKTITADVLTRVPLILMDEDSTVRAVTDRAFRLAGQQVKPFIEATYMATAVGMVRAGLGVALLPSTAAEAKPSGRVKSRPVSGKSFVRPIVVVRKAGRTLPPASEAFLATIAKTAMHGWQAG